jgi:molecular chaperone DnaJ
MAKRDYYEVLGVKKTASEKEIKKAYRTIAKDNHPDVKPDDKAAEELFREAAEAYETLKDQEKKSSYDRFGHQQGGVGGQGRGNMEDMMHEMFGRRQQVRKGENLRLNLKLTLEEIFNGVKKSLKYNKQIVCNPCNGKGGHNVRSCGVCKGAGVMYRNIRMGNQMFQEQSTCHSCRGTGELVSDICKVCRGAKTISKETTLDMEIPTGVIDGTQILSEGGGHGIPNGNSGDVLIVLTQKPHDTFTRSGNDLKVNLSLSYTQLVLGDKIEINTIEGGKIRATIPPYSNVGDNLRIPNKGMNVLHANGKRGDMIMILNISVPTKVSDEERGLLEKLQDIQNKVAQ